MLKLVVVWLAGLLLGLAHAAPLQASNAISQLRKLRDNSPDKVVTLDDAQFARFGRSVGRDYSIIVFLNAHQMAERPQLKLGEVRKEFGYAAQAMLAGPDPDAAFFAEMVRPCVPMQVRREVTVEQSSSANPSMLIHGCMPGLIRHECTAEHSSSANSSTKRILQPSNPD